MQMKIERYIPFSKISSKIFLPPTAISFCSPEDLTTGLAFTCRHPARCKWLTPHDAPFLTPLWAVGETSVTAVLLSNACAYDSFSHTTTCVCCLKTAWLRAVIFRLSTRPYLSECARARRHFVLSSHHVTARRLLVGLLVGYNWKGSCRKFFGWDQSLKKYQCEIGREERVSIPFCVLSLIPHFQPTDRVKGSNGKLLSFRTPLFPVFPRD